MWFSVLNRPLPSPRSIAPTDFLNALERKFGGRINRDQQVKEINDSLEYHLQVFVRMLMNYFRLYQVY